MNYWTLLAELAFPYDVRTTITPDIKTWTSVLDYPCPECGCDTAATAFGDVPGVFVSRAEDWRRILAGSASG